MSMMGKVDCELHGPKSIVSMGSFTVTLECGAVGSTEDGWSHVSDDTIEKVAELVADMFGYSRTELESYGFRAGRDTAEWSSGGPMTAVLSWEEGPYEWYREFTDYPDHPISKFLQSKGLHAEVICGWGLVGLYS